MVMCNRLRIVLVNVIVKDDFSALLIEFAVRGTASNSADLLFRAHNVTAMLCMPNFHESKNQHSWKPAIFYIVEQFLWGLMLIRTKRIAFRA